MMADLKHEFYQLLRTNEAAFDFVQEFALEGAWYWDLENTQHRWLNPKCYAVLEYPPHQWPHWQRLIPPDDWLSTTREWADDSPPPDADQAVEMRYLHRDQSISLVTGRSRLIRNQQGKPIRLLGAQTKLTHQQPKIPLPGEQQSLYQGLVANQSIYVIKTDLNGNYTFVNDYFCQVFDLNASALFGTSSLESIDGEDHAICLEAVTQCLQQPGNVCKVRLRKPLGQGRLRYTQWEFIAQSSAISKATELLCIGYDVTDTVKVEDDLSVLMSTMRESLLSIGRDGLLRYVAPSWSRLYGYSVQESMGKPFATFIHPDDVAGWEVALTGVVDRGIGCTVEQRIRHHQGGWLWSTTQISVDLLKEELFITSYEITDRKRAEAAQRESEQRFEEIAEHVDEAFWIHSVEPFELLYINSAYERVFGPVSRRGAADTTFFLPSVMEADRVRVKAEFSKYRQGQEVMFQCRVRGAHQDIRWLHIRTFVMKDNRGVPVRYVGIVNDISSQKEKERILQQSLLQEQELNRLKSAFVATASHEFRTPLATIQSSVDLIGLYVDSPADNARGLIARHLGVIQKEIVKFSTLLTDMLTIGQIEAGKIAFTPQWVDILGVCGSVIDTHFSGRPDQRRVQTQILGAPRPGYVDEKLMSHVLINLLSNAFKFSSSNPQLRVDFGAGQLLLQVIDQGIGISAADRANLFQAFFRAGNPQATQGTGLGLVIARQFVVLHGGTLEVASEPGQGTVFTVTLPVSVDATIQPALQPNCLADLGHQPGRRPYKTN